MATAEKRARVAIIEDGPVLRDELAYAVDQAPDLEVVGVAECLSRGRELLALGVDVLPTDLAIPPGAWGDDG